nr:hypothetical protein Iba_chr06cCG14480 [Ipomoea batatas]
MNHPHLTQSDVYMSQLYRCDNLPIFRWCRICSLERYSHPLRSRVCKLSKEQIESGNFSTLLILKVVQKGNHILQDLEFASYSKNKLHQKWKQDPKVFQFFAMKDDVDFQFLPYPPVHQYCSIRFSEITLCYPNSDELIHLYFIIFGKDSTVKSRIKFLYFLGDVSMHDKLFEMETTAAQVLDLFKPELDALFLKASPLCIIQYLPDFLEL